MAKTARSTVTRGRIADAARELFCELGYRDTTMAAIAGGAGVAVQTLYLRYGSKAAILAEALDVAIAGDDDPVPIAQRPAVQQALAQRDGVAMLAGLVGVARSVVERSHQLWAVIVSASSDPDVAAVRDRNRRQRAVGLRQFADALAERKGFDESLGAERAGDLLYALMTEESFLVFVVDRGWSPDDWEQWVVATLTAQLFPSVRPRARR